ncbi:MAG: PEP-CTERM sorting domain-containing protein [Verrucomicrobia bacterium]|nr:PEP-CTERM sorting domain-containing protein [Verrucomicrobiota bacterium]
MKKLTVVCVALTIALSASAQDMWSYAIQFTTAPELASESGAGAGWYVALMSGSSELDATSVFNNSSGTFNILPYNTVAIAEGLDVFYRIYNSASVPSGSYWQIDSSPATLQDLSPGFLPGANNVTLSFSSSSWQAVPEPATALLFGIGGMGAFVLRRNKLKAKEEADA